MKQRNGFVSNSSSSSFVIAIKKSANEPCPHCGRSDPNILGVIENQERQDEDTFIVGTGIGDALAFADRLSKYGVNTETERLKKEIAELGEDWGFAVFQVSYRDTFLEILLQNEEKAGTIKCLYQEG